MSSIPGFLFPLIYLGFVAVERLFPARPQPRVGWWVPKGVLFFALGGALSGAVAPHVGVWAAAHRLVDLRALGFAGGTLVGLVALDFVMYWWHRARHSFGPLWRLHQLHHSSERLDAVGAFYFHPLETVIAVSLSALVGGLLGLDPRAIAALGVSTLVIALIQHANLRTPRWLGYVIQRPEQHALHHERGVHARNYGGFALWDRLFGTYANPATFTGAVGFWDGASRRLGRLLIGADVSAPPAGAQVGAQPRGR
jgi:sterol desaturase/sphingolipid hydroxylase (fatty acid hydroxylase superfamily)